MSVPNLTLNNGVEMPVLGFGVFQTPPDETVAAVETALARRARHRRPRRTGTGGDHPRDVLDGHPGGLTRPGRSRRAALPPGGTARDTGGSAGRAGRLLALSHKA